jgi:hypothetical protein
MNKYSLSRAIDNYEKEATWKGILF